MHDFVARRSIRAVIAGLLLLLLAGSPGSRQQASAATDPSGSGLLAALATPAEIQAVSPGVWTPLYPLFEVPDRSVTDYRPGWVRSTMLDVQRTDSAGATNGAVYTRLVLYQDDAAAKAAYTAGAADDTDGTMPLPGVAVTGDESRAFTNVFPVADVPEDAYRMETFVRFRSGRIIGIVDAQLPAHLTAAQIGALTTPVAARAASVLSGALTASALPATLAAVMPPASVGTLIGPLLGQAALTPETYATGFASGELARVKSLGVTSIGFQVYATSTVAGHLLVVSVIPMKDEASARDYVLFDDAALTTPSRNTIPTGATGPYSIFRKFDDANNNYDFQLARNKYVVVLRCTPVDAQNDRVSDDCLAITRRAAEAIYAGLPAGTLTPTPAATPSQPPATPAGTATQPPATAPRPPNTGSGAGSDSDANSILIVVGLLLMVASAYAITASRPA